MRRLNNVYGSNLNWWMVVEVGSHKLTVPPPIIFCICRRVDAGKAAATLDKPFEGCLLVEIENIAGRIKEDNDLILRQTCVGENRGVFAAVNAKMLRVP